MTVFRADLHCHSTFSDGTLTPEELVARAAACHLSGLSITDHDTIDAYSQAFEAAEKRGIKLLIGVEFSSFHRMEAIHILSYGFAREGAVWELCKRQGEIRRQRNEAMLEKLKKVCHIDLVLQDKPLGSLGRPHIAQALVEKGAVKSVREAFERYLGEGKAAYVPGERLQVEEVIEWIHRGQGIAILAHPHLIVRQRILKELLNMPFDGIEAYYANFPRDRVAPFLQIAKEKNWLATGGSDFHGDSKPYQALGSSYVTEEVFNRLYALH